MNLGEIEENVRAVLNNFDRETFIYALLAAYGKPRASLTRLQKGNLNLSKETDEVVWKKNVYYKHIPSGSSVDIHVIADQLKRSDAIGKHDLRFVVVTDFKTLLAVDTKTFETLDVPIMQLAKHAHFFLPWTGQEKHKSHNENPADIKAAYKMGKLYDEICIQNPEMRTTENHSLNVFLARLLFCFFAEDTEIFPINGMFTDSIASHTQEDASDLSKYLEGLWTVLNTEKRKNVPGYFEKFPYVNGGLFAEDLRPPKFSRSARKIILECGELDWSEINPDIFGSMMQAVVRSEERGSMHYTSVGNIMKVIGPLFLDDLRQSFDDSFNNQKALEKLRTRLSTIQIFDPACGSGNFLIIAFKELRRLEMEIFLRLRELDPSYQTLFTLPQIKLTQFYGIELGDFAHEIAILSLWLAEHQMNVKFKQSLGILVPPLPLKAGGNVACGNATRLDWNVICPKTSESETYILGNPPYVGYSLQEDSQKSDMAAALGDVPNYKNLDYIACWFVKGAKYIEKTNSQLAFVSTNSLCQGEQVALLWPEILERGLEIGFAYKAFKWNNNAKHNAGVTCSIVGLRSESDNVKKLFSESTVQEVKNINPYLAGARNVIVQKLSKPISDLPPMLRGSSPVDDGNLILSDEERRETVRLFPASKKFLKKLIGSSEFIRGFYRWCIWVEPKDVIEAQSIKPFSNRFEKVRKFRLESKKAATKEIANIPYRFGESRYVNGSSIIVPRVSSERREYVPMGFLTEDMVITDLAFGIYAPEPWVFAIITSRMHNTWVRSVSGRMRTDIRYSVRLCYNTFPMPSLTQKQKDTLTTHAFNILAEREKHPEKSMANMYDPDKMPKDLLQAHEDLDTAVERCYRSKPFSRDEERLDVLFSLYEEMTANGVEIDDGDDSDA